MKQMLIGLVVVLFLVVAVSMIFSDDEAVTQGAVETDTIASDSAPTGTAPIYSDDDGGLATVGGSDRVVTEETPPASAASELSTDVATEIARDGEAPSDATRAAALIAAIEEGSTGAVEAFTVEGFDRDLVRLALTHSDMSEEVREEYLAELAQVGPDDDALVILLTRVRAELGI